MLIDACSSNADARAQRALTSWLNVELARSAGSAPVQRRWILRGTNILMILITYDKRRRPFAIHDVITMRHVLGRQSVVLRPLAHRLQREADGG